MEGENSGRRLTDFFDEKTARAAGLVEARYGEDAPVTGLEYDSRRVQPGNAYFALRGLHADGRAFIADAVKAGARVIVYQDALDDFAPGVTYLRVRDARFAMSPVAAAFYGRPSRELAVIGVTGTEGKSTTVYLIYQMLEALGRKTAFVSTVKWGDGAGEYWNSEHQTTPEAVTLQRLLAAARDNGATIAVVEASSHGLSRRTNRLGDVCFDAGVMTNVTHEHLEFHGTWDQYRCDKAELFRGLGSCRKSAALLGREGPLPVFGVVNADDPSAAYFAAAAGRPVYTYSTRGGEADLSIETIESRAGGNSYLVRAGDKTFPVEDNLPGAFNAGNTLAGLLVVSRLLALDAETLAGIVPRLKPVRGRMTAVERGQPFEVLVDYAHTPSSFEAIFQPLRTRLDRTGGRIISLFGSAGERDTQKRPEQGRIAAAYSDVVILTDEDPRGEDPQTILEEIARGVTGKTRGEDLFLIPPRPEAIRKAFSLARPGDLVLLLGKGHENSIIYAHETRPYDEIREAEAALDELS